MLTKRDVVRRELASAIRLFLTDGDPVAVHVLASAAGAILRDMGKARGVATWREEAITRVRAQYQRIWDARLDEPFNFMKHGSKDPNETLTTFNPNILHVALLLAVWDFNSVFSSGFVEGSVFLAYIADTEPRLLKTDPNEALIKILSAVRGLAQIDRIDKRTAARALAQIDKLVNSGQIPAASFENLAVG